jgi:hypothetical protein
VQLQITAPSSALSHLGADLQLFDLCISLQLSTPIQAHLVSPAGVSKQSNLALAVECASSSVSRMIAMKRAIRMSPSTSRWRSKIALHASVVAHFFEGDCSSQPNLARPLAPQLSVILIEG